MRLAPVVRVAPTLVLTVGLTIVSAMALGCRPPGADPGDDRADASVPETDATSRADAAIATDGTDATPSSVRIATANLRCLIEDWDTRKALIADELAKLAADFVVLQEVCRVPDGHDALPELLDAIEGRSGLRYHALRGATHLAWDTYEEGIALLSRVTPSTELVLNLPRGTFPRKAVLVRIEGIVVAGTHLSFGAENAAVRRAQLAAIRAELERLRQPGDALVIAGDFNETDDGLAISDSTNDGYVDAWAVAHPGEPGSTVPADAPAARIDYVLISGAMPSAAQLFMDAAVDGVWPSDHRGVWADLPLR